MGAVRLTTWLVVGVAVLGGLAIGVIFTLPSRFVLPAATVQARILLAILVLLLLAGLALFLFVLLHMPTPRRFAHNAYRAGFALTTFAVVSPGVAMVYVSLTRDRGLEFSLESSSPLAVVVGGLLLFTWYFGRLYVRLAVDVPTTTSARTSAG